MTPIFNLMGERKMEENEIFEVLSEAKKIGDKLQIKLDTHHIEEKLKTRTFYLVVLGQFKRGKTTFINAMLEKEILPSAPLPLTSVPTIVRYGKTKCIVRFKSGESKEINIEEVPEYVTELKNPKNEKRVEEVIVYYPAKLLKQITIVDTPGIGSTHKHNTEVTLSFLPKCDVAVFITSVDPPITEAELEFLRNIKKHSDKIFFLLNKIDYFSKEEAEQMLEYVKNLIQKEVGKEIKIYPLSAKKALEGKKEESLISEFEQALHAFLRKEKERVIISSSKRQLIWILSSLQNTLELEIKALETPLGELEEKVARFNKYLNEIEEKSDYAIYLLKKGFENALKTIEQDMQVFYQQTLPILDKKLEDFYMENKHLKGSELREKLENFMKEEIKNIFNEKIEEESKKIEALLEEDLKKASRNIMEITEEIREKASGVFGAKYIKTEKQELLSHEISFSFYFTFPTSGLEIALPAAFSRLPKFISHKYLLKSYKEELESSLDRHCGRTREYFSRRIEKSKLEYVRKFREKIDEVISEIKNTIERAKETKLKSEKDVSKKLEELRAMSKKIGELQRRMSL